MDIFRLAFGCFQLLALPKNGRFVFRRRPPADSIYAPPLSPSSFRFPAVAFIHHDQNSAICFSSPSPGIIPDYPSSGLEMIAVGGYFYVTVQKCHNQLQNFGAALVVQQITSDFACTESNTGGVQRW